MRYLTDRKRAIGLGSAKSGTAHFWAMKVSSVALLILVPLFIFTFGPRYWGSRLTWCSTTTRALSRPLSPR